MNENLKFGLGIAGIVILTVCTGILVYGLTQFFTIDTSGVITGSDLTPSQTTIDWGTVPIGVPVDRSVDFTNTGTTTISGLTMSTTNEIGISDYSCIWDYDGTAIAPDGIKTVTFTLTVNSYSNPSPDFSFDIIVSGNP